MELAKPVAARLDDGGGCDLPPEIAQEEVLPLDDVVPLGGGRGRVRGGRAAGGSRGSGRSRMRKPAAASGRSVPRLFDPDVHAAEQAAEQAAPEQQHAAPATPEQKDVKQEASPYFDDEAQGSDSGVEIVPRAGHDSQWTLVVRALGSGGSRDKCQVLCVTPRSVDGVPETPLSICQHIAAAIAPELVGVKPPVIGALWVLSIRELCKQVRDRILAEHAAAPARKAKRPKIVE